MSVLRSYRGALSAIATIALVVGLVTVAGPALLRTAVPRTVEPPGFAVTPEGDDVSRLAPITVRFPQEPSDRTAEKLFQLEPSVRGTYAWLGARTLLFQPDFPGLLRGASYTVHVPAGPDSGLPADVRRKFTVTGALTVQQIIPSDGDTQVPLNAQVLVQFSRSVAPLTTLAAQRTTPVVTFDPPLAGSGEWLNTSIYRFIPTDLQPATTYRLIVAKGLTSAADGVLKDDVRATFTTITPHVASIDPDDNTQFASPRQQVTVTFDQAMDPSAAAGIAVRDAAGATLLGSIAWSADGTAATFTPSSELGRSAVYVVSVEKGLRGKRGGETPALRTSSFKTVGIPSVQQTFPKDGETSAGRFGVNLRFTNPMDKDSLEGKLSISGLTAADLEGNVFNDEFGIGANVALAPSTHYDVDLAAGAKDRYGQTMGAFHFSFTTGALPSSVSLALPGFQGFTTYASSTDQILWYQATNIPTATFTLYPLTKVEAHVLISGQPRPGGPFQPSLPALRTWTETVTGGRDQVILGSTSLGAGKPLPKGYYFVRTGGQLRSEFAFAVVDTEVVTKLSVDELLAWVIDHDTGKPLGGITLSASGPQVSPETATTDANGLASFSVPKPVLGTSIDRSYYVLVDDGSRLGVASTRWNNGISPFQFNLPGDYFARTYVGQLYMDRPIYRPGETVDYKGIVRTDDDAQYAVPTGDVPLELVIMNPRGQQVKREDVQLNAFGTFAGTFDLPSDAPLGSYFLNVRMKSSSPNAQFGIFSNSFVIAEFRKPEFQVEVAPAKPSYVDGDRIDVRTTATFYFGGPLAGAGVQWSALGFPYSIAVKGFERYSFSDVDASIQNVRRDPFRASGTATTGPDGSASYSVPASLPAGGTAQQVTLSATVTDQNSQGVAGSTTVTVHPAQVYAGIHPAQYVATAGSPARVDLVTVDTDGKILPAQAVTVRAYDRRWITSKQETPGGGRRYTSVPRDTLLDTLTATTDAKGLASVTYTPARSGMLRLVAEVTDGRGRTSRSASSLWVSGPGTASWQVTNDDALKLVADREQYEVGDTADVIVPAPFDGAIGLVTIERGKVITREIRRFPTNSERLRIPITDRSVPDVFVSVVLYRAPTKDDPIPRFKVGYAELKVSTATRALTVKAKADKERAKPGDTVHYDISVADRSGKGVRAEVSVAVVDKAILALEDERGPDGLHAFWFERGLAVSTASSVSVSMDRANDVIAEAPKVGKGGSGSGQQQDGTRKDFRNTAFWSAQLTTDGDGRASVDVTMPDNLTTWRIQVRAVSGDTMVGEGTSETLVTQPLLVRPALPRFLRVGDTTEIRALVRNGTTTDMSADVTLKAEGVTARAEPRTVRIAAGATALVSWPATVEAEGTARITFSASGGGQSDSVVQSLPVLLDVTPETTATGGIVTTQPGLEAVYLPPFARTKPGSLSVAVRSALVGPMADELIPLAPTDYEGAERVASRLLATIAVRRAEKSATGSSSRYDARITSDVAGLIGRQRGDGGWSWCDEPQCTTDPYVTGWVLLALGEAKRDGIAVDQNVSSRASQYVFVILGQPFDVAAPQRPPGKDVVPFKPGIVQPPVPIQADPSHRAFLLAAVASASRVSGSLPASGSPALSPARALFEQHRTQLSSWGRAYLLLALDDAGVPHDDPAVRALLNDVAAAALPSATGDHWEDPATGGAFMTSTGTTALVTLALARVQPDQQLLPQSVRWLVVARGADGWRTSIDRSMAVLGLTTYAAGTGELGGDYAYTVKLGTTQLLAGAAKQGQLLTAATEPLPLSMLTPGQVGLVAFERDYEKPGRLYYTLGLRYATPAKDVEALNRGFGISHVYTALDDPTKPVTKVRAGDTVRVTLTVVAPADRTYVTLEDLLPAGLEPVDTRLKTVDPRLKQQLDQERTQALAKDSGTGFVAPWYRWYYSPWQHVDVRDDRTVLMADRLPKGVYEYVYYARATTPGDFFVGPAHAEETYFPEVFGRSDSSRFVVVP